jgi:NDP-sugar pyrophosphorylase family protein
MKAIILAAGEGRRLRPLTYSIPKPLLPVGGRPVMDFAIENLERCGEIDEIFIAVSHMADSIGEYVRHAHGSGISIVRTMRQETGGDLREVIEEAGIRGDVAVCYGDNVTRIDIKPLLRLHKGSDALASLTLFSVPQKDVERFGIAETEGARITKFLEKPRAGQTRSRLANAGYFVMRSGAIGDLRGSFKLEAECFPLWAKRRLLLGQVHELPYWMDIGTLESYREANRMVESVLPPPGRSD